MKTLKEQILALPARNEHHYLWPGEKAGYREGVAEVKEAAAALVAASEAQGEQKPVAEVRLSEPNEHGECFAMVNTLGDFDLENFPDGTKFYLAPPQAGEKLREVLEQLVAFADAELSNTTMLTGTPPKSSAAFNISGRIRAVLASLPESVPDWVLAPENPTQMMRDAGNRKLDELKSEPGMGIADRAFYVYLAMLAARPTPK